MPTYYIMELHKGMAATVAPEMPSPAEIASCKWLTEQELSVYSAEYLRTGFQGGLNWYRCRTQNVDSAELELFSGRQIEVPSLFIAGRKDWGIYQVPGSIERMQNSACTRMRPHVLVDGCRTLGAAGAAREGVRAVARLSAAARSLTERSFSAPGRSGTGGRPRAVKSRSPAGRGMHVQRIQRVFRDVVMPGSPLGSDRSYRRFPVALDMHPWLDNHATIRS